MSYKNRNVDIIVGINWFATKYFNRISFTDYYRLISCHYIHTVPLRHNKLLF